MQFSCNDSIPRQSNLRKVMYASRGSSSVLLEISIQQIFKEPSYFDLWSMTYEMPPEWEAQLLQGTIEPDHAVEGLHAINFSC